MPGIKFVQVGSPKDPLLENVIDGRLLSIRKTATIIFNSKLYVGLEGGLTHVARAG